VADDVVELTARLDEAIREEVSHYPGEDEVSDRCTSDEESCMAAHVHLAWRSGDEVTVYASVGALARLCVAVLQDAGWQRARGDVVSGAVRVLEAQARRLRATYRAQAIPYDYVQGFESALDMFVDAFTQPEGSPE
jgi:hypothetical protein